MLFSGIQLSESINGGEFVDRHAFGFVLQILDPGRNYRCACTLITLKHVLTLRNCVIHGGLITLRDDHFIDLVYSINIQYVRYIRLINNSKSEDDLAIIQVTNVFILKFVYNR